MKYRFRVKAQSDLNNIFDYSARQHGPEVADRYLASIGAALDRLCDFPKLGAARRTRPALRSYPVGEHRIYYQVADGELLVVRILHKAMDIESRL